MRRPAAVAALVCLTVVTCLAVAACRPPEDHRARPDPRWSPPSHAPGECALWIQNSGFANRYGDLPGGNVPKRRGVIEFGVVVVNPCRRIADDIRIEIRAQDRRGEDATVLATAHRKLPRLRWNWKVPVAGTLRNDGRYDASAVSALTVRVTHVRWGAAEDRQTWRPAVAAGNLDIGPRGEHGYAVISYNLLMHHLGRPTWLSVIVMNDKQRIVAGERVRVTGHPSEGERVRARVWLPPGVTDPMVLTEFEVERS